MTDIIVKPEGVGAAATAGAELSKAFMDKYGARVQSVLVETFHAIQREGDGDSLFLFHRQLVEMILILQEYAAALPVVSDHDSEQYLKMKMN
jgi:hypothetical protein